MLESPRGILRILWISKGFKSWCIKGTFHLLSCGIIKSETKYTPQLGGLVVESLKFDELGFHWSSHKEISLPLPIL